MKISIFFPIFLSSNKYHQYVDTNYKLIGTVVNAVAIKRAEAFRTIKILILQNKISSGCQPLEILHKLSKKNSLWLVLIFLGKKRVLCFFEKGVTRVKLLDTAPSC